jgi:hypothetical protein
MLGPRLIRPGFAEQPPVTGNVPVSDRNRIQLVGPISALKLAAKTNTFQAKFF